MRHLKLRLKYLFPSIILLTIPFAFLTPITSAAVRTITFQTTTKTGSILFDGTTFTNGQVGNYPDGTHNITAVPPSNANFTAWSATGGISIVDPSHKTTQVIVTADGTLTANFSPFALPPALIVELAILTSAIVILRRRKN